MTKKLGLPERKAKKKTQGMIKTRVSSGFKVTRPPCAGKFLNGLYGLMAKDVQEAKVSEDWKNGAFNAMNQTLVVMSNWCGCYTCKKRAREILELAQKKNEEIEDEDQNKGHQSLD